MKDKQESPLRLGNPRRFWGVSGLLLGLLALVLLLNVNIGSVSILSLIHISEPTRRS